MHEEEVVEKTAFTICVSRSHSLYVGIAQNNFEFEYFQSILLNIIIEKYQFFSLFSHFSM